MSMLQWVQIVKEFFYEKEMDILVFGCNVHSAGCC